jgi:hypothetical protein
LLPEALRVSYTDIANALRTRLHRRARLSSDARLSIRMWLAKLEEKGWSTLFQDDLPNQEWLVAIVSPFQKEVRQFPDGALFVNS